jgi:hypothetical protein
MLQIQKDQNKLFPLQQFKLIPTTAGEPARLRELVLNSPAEFIREIGDSFFVIGRDFALLEDKQLVCDLLGLDERGQAVIVIVAQANETSPLVRGITCAGLISRWKQDDFLR